MALFNPILGSLSGKLGGNVFSRNRNGAYVRVKVSPVNPNTPDQNNARAALAQFSSEWSEVLSVAERDAWTAYALNTPLTNVFGNTYFMTGQQAFIRTNTIVFPETGFRRPNAPGFNGEAPIPDLATPGSVVIANEDSGIPNVITIDPALVTNFVHDLSGAVLQVWTSLPQNLAVLFPPANRKKAGSISSDTGSPPPATSFPLPAPAVAAVPFFVYIRQMDFFGRVSPIYTTRVQAQLVP